jgi:hypothetical protein
MGIKIADVDAVLMPNSWITGVSSDIFKVIYCT